VCVGPAGVPPRDTTEGAGAAPLAVSAVRRSPTGPSGCAPRVRRCPRSAASSQLSLELQRTEHGEEERAEYDDTADELDNATRDGAFRSLPASTIALVEKRHYCSIGTRARRRSR
jgi:hypothetical protein